MIESRLVTVLEVLRDLDSNQLRLARD